MKKIIKTVIASGGYKLADMQNKIRKLYAMGSLSEADMNELLTLAANGVSVEAERPEAVQLVLQLAESIAELDERVRVLEGNPDIPDEPVEPGEYPAWKPWNGISNDYQPGAIVKHNGKVWISTFSGQNVWEPGTVGEQFWAEYTG